MRNLNTVFSSWKNRHTSVDIFYNEFIDYCFKLTRKILNNYNLQKVSVKDFEDLFPQIFMYVTRNYIPEKMPFDKYVGFILSRRLTQEIVDKYFVDGKYVISLDQVNEDGTPFLELIEDTNSLTVPEQVRLDSFKSQMNSPKAEESILDRRCRLIVQLSFLGYPRKEIIKKLNITLSQFRCCQNHIKKDKKFEIFKMELN